ncbi:MAG: amidase [Pseudomonas sp.]
MSAFIKRRPFSSLLLLIVVVLAGLAWQNRVHLAAFPGIIGALTAKEYCSCRYVMDNEASYCQSYVKQIIPTSGFFDDVANKRVTARGLGSTQTAEWKGQREGCQLLPQAVELPKS